MASWPPPGMKREGEMVSAMKEGSPLSPAEGKYLSSVQQAASGNGAYCVEEASLPPLGSPPSADANAGDG